MSIKRAVLIGINYFNTDAELSGCINDITDVRKYLELVGFTEFTILQDSREDVKHVAMNAPTRKNIIAALNYAIGQTKSGDTLYVHYSGHGSNLADQRLYRDGRDENDNRDECICPVDFGWTQTDSGFIRDDHLHSILVDGLAAGAKLRVVFDSCHSGSAIDLPFRWISGSDYVSENADFTGGDIVFISGCKDSEVSMDSVFDNRANGALTWAFLRSLAEIKKSATVNFCWKDLCEMIRLRLLRGGYEQNSQICVESLAQLRSRVDLI